MFSSVPSSNIDDLLYLIHSKHFFLNFTTDYTTVSTGKIGVICGEYIQLLMLLTQQVVHCFYRVESGKWHFYKDGIPVTHRSVPQAGKFESFQVFAVLRFVGDEACCFIYILHQVELMPL